MRKRTIVSIVLLFCAATLRAQIVLTSLNTPVEQHFDSLIASGSAPWIDNTTIRGWYHARTGTGNLLTASDGGSSAGGFYSFGSAGAAERALGSIGSGGAAIGDICYGVRLLNNTGAVITGLDISYFGEQWRNSGAAAQSVTFAYRTGTGLTGLLTGTWSAVPALDFTGPVSGGTAGPLNGNLPANRLRIGALLSGLSIPDGQEILLRWYDPDHPGADHGLAIDDLAILPLGVAGPTTVQFSLDSSSFSEHAGAAIIQVSIANPSPTAATSVEIAWAGGTAANGADVVPPFAAQTLLFPAGSGAPQSVSLPLFDDSLCEGDETAVLQLQNAAGGYLAQIGASALHTLTILDDDLPPDPAVVVNEVYNGNGALNTDEAVELIVRADHADLRGWTLADATGAGAYPHGIVAFSNDPLWSDLEAGTLILIGGTESVPAPDDDPSDGLLLLRVPAAGHSNRYFSANGSSITISGSSDAVAVRDASGAHVHGLAHGAPNRATLPANRHGWHGGSVATGHSLFFARAGAPMTAQDFNHDTFTAVGNATPGNPNDADGNRSFLRGARSRSVAGSVTLSGTFYWDVTVNGGIVQQGGPVNVCNALTLNDGTWEASDSLAVEGNGNAQNGIGAGVCTIGDGDLSAALLRIHGAFGPIGGAANLAQRDATVEYRGAVTQNILPAEYNNVSFAFGGAANRKILAGAAPVYGTLSIDAGAYLYVPPPYIITLGAAGVFQNAGRFLGNIRTTRPVAALGATEDFGNIGFSITPNAYPLPGPTTVTMTSGVRLWVNDLPSILKYYTVAASNGSGGPAAIRFRYEDADLNGQIESNLGLRYAPGGGAGWISPGGALDASANTIDLSVSNLNGIWTAHANPPRGVIAANADSLLFETEEFGPLPASQPLAISNAKGDGSIIEWSGTASCATAPPWLSLAPPLPAGVNGGGFQADVLRSDLAPGLYDGGVAIADPHAANNPLLIPVSYRVHKRREICVGTDTVFFKASFKLPDASKPVAVLNCGESFGPGVISWNAAAAPAPILSLALSAGLEGSAFALSAKTQWRSPGNYPGTVAIAGVNSILGTPIWNSPLAVPVMVEIEPSTDFIATTGALAAGSSYTIKNALGQRVAIVKVNEGSISSLTVKMFPYQLPSGLARLRYVRRYYRFDAVSTHYNVDLTLFYTRHELLPVNVRNLSLLRGWRQYPAGGAWQSTAGVSDTMGNAVTIAGITELAGNWGMATPWTPKESAVPLPAGPLALEQNAPNPVSLTAHPATRISFTLPEKGRARVELFDALGKLAATPLDAELEAGRHEFLFDASALHSGVYICRLTASSGTRTRMLAVVR